MANVKRLHWTIEGDMNSKIFILAFAACCGVALAQRPTVLPFPTLGATGVPPFMGAFNNNWVRPYYAAAAEGWRTYFEQLQQARNQLYQTLTNLQNTAQNGDLQAPTVEAPAVVAHDIPQEIQVVQTVTRPQVQTETAKARPQVTVTHTVTQTQPNRQPQNLGLQGVAATATRPVASQVGSVPQVASQIVPQVGGQIVPQVSGQIVPQVGSQVPQVPSWVGK